jgi:prepilin-type N-terminal cleavage/methylation domain-containing protein
MNKNGYTLVELMISIGIIGILISISTLSYGNIRARAQANKVATDFQQIRLGWELWKNTNNAAWPEEGDTTNPDIICDPDPFTEPSIDQTVVQTYLGDVYQDPWGIRYSYDNDQDTFTTGGDADSGVNIAMQWCAGNGELYIRLAPIIDQTIDGGDGETAGKVRWTTNPSVNGGVYFLLAANETS